MMEVKNGTRCAITEQGDLGLGLTPVDESVEKKEEKDKKEKSKNNEFFK